jgi:putative membrane protein
LGFVALLLVYQAIGHRIWSSLRTHEAPWSSTTYRLLNEVPTVILIAAVFLVVYKDSVSWLGGVAGILGVALTLTIAVRAYKNLRERKS